MPSGLPQSTKSHSLHSHIPPKNPLESPQMFQTCPEIHKITQSTFKHRPDVHETAQKCFQTSPKSIRSPQTLNLPQIVLQTTPKSTTYPKLWLSNWGSPIVQIGLAVKNTPFPPSFPALSCPPHSHYELCTRTCDFTCASLSVPTPCSWQCFEGCQCDDGFLFDGSSCVSLEQCGCVHQGRYLKVRLARKVWGWKSGGRFVGWGSSHLTEANYLGGWGTGGLVVGGEGRPVLMQRVWGLSV